MRSSFKPNVTFRPTWNRGRLKADKVGMSHVTMSGCHVRLLVMLLSRELRLIRVDAMRDKYCWCSEDLSRAVRCIASTLMSRSSRPFGRQLSTTVNAIRELCGERLTSYCSRHSSNLQRSCRLTLHLILS